MDKNSRNHKNTNIKDDDDTLYHPVTGKKLEPPPNMRKKKLFKSEYAVFYIVTLLIAVLISIILFAYMLNRIRDNTPPTDYLFTLDNNFGNGDDGDDDILAINEDVTSLGVIQHIDSNNRVIQVYDIASRNTLTLNVEGSTILRYRFGQSVVFAEFALGDIVNSTFNPDNNTLSSLQISNEAWERRLVSGVEVNELNNTITIGQDRFIYTDITQVFNNGEIDSIVNIHPLNTVTMRGVDNTVWFIEIERGLGTVRVINDNEIINGSMEIARSMSIPLGESIDINDKEVNMPEGTHRITVRGSNIAPYIDEIVVNNGQTTIVDLSVIPLTAGTLTITTNVPTAVVSINGRPVDITQPINLNYGEYRITAQSPDYQPFEGTLTLDSPNQHFAFELEPEIVTGRLEVLSSPDGAEVLVDNVFVGVTPLTTTVEQGVRSVTLRKEGFISTTMDVYIGDEPRVPPIIELQPEIQLTLPLEEPILTPGEVDPNTTLPIVEPNPDYTFIPGPGQ